MAASKASDFSKWRKFCRANQVRLQSQEAIELEAQIQAQGHKFYGIFADDPGALEIFDEIEQLRDQHPPSAQTTA